MRHKEEIKNAAAVFTVTYAAFRVYTKVISPRWPRYNRHLYVMGRRVHHFESGLYLAALGLALFLEDYHDWISTNG